MSPLTLSEQALKQKQLDDLDALLGEFGVEGETMFFWFGFSLFFWWVVFFLHFFFFFPPTFNVEG